MGKSRPEIGLWYKNRYLQRRNSQIKKTTRSKHKISAAYRRYLLSDWWKTRKRRKISSVGCKCENCGTSGVILHVHHLSYQRLGAELDSDLEVLCELCHKSKHPGWE